MISRREIIGALAVFGSAVAAWPRAARAQQQMPMIGFLNPRSPDQAANVVAAFREGLSEAGYVEGRNVAVEYRWAEDRNERLPELAAELASRRVDTIVAGATTSARAAMAATKTIPIVFTTAGDPVRYGLVDSISRPGGNVTGATFYSSLLVPKHLELLRELAPNASTIGLLVGPSPPSAEASEADARAAARVTGQQITILKAGSDAELNALFASLVSLRIGALLLGVDPFFDSRPARAVELAARYAVPTVYYLREFVVAGGLMSYGGSIADTYRQAGRYAGQILKGAKPADLPILQPTKFEFVINLRTAKALGVTIPQSFLLRADEVIE